MTSNYSISEINIKDKARWSDLLTNSPLSHYLASMPYEYSREISGRSISTFIFSQNGIDIAGAHYSIKKSFAGLIQTADIISGIIFREKANAEVAQFIINHFINWAKSKKITYLRITPWLPKIKGGVKTKYGITLNALFLESGFKFLSAGRHTYWLDLTLDEVGLLKIMKAQTRRKIKQAEKANLIVESYDQYSHEKVSTFYELYSKLGNRKDFETLSKSRFFIEIKALFKAGATLFFLKYENVIIDVSLATNYGIASYYHGALNPDYKNLKNCPSPGHFIQWIMIKYMKKKGLKIYDMAFCPGPVPIKTHPRFDMWRFKFGFGGDHVEFLPTYGKILRPIKGRIFQFIKYKK